MDTSRQHLRAYYEEEARLRRRKPVVGRRVDLRDEFIELLRAERRRSVVDFGSGPGRDGELFVAAGLDFVGIDLAHANGVLAAERGVMVVQGSLDAPPCRPHAFDAGWSMSTLMHIPEAEVPACLTAMTSTLHAGAPFVIGMWGGDQGDIVSNVGLAGQERLFSLRPFDVNRALVATHGQVERAFDWDVGDVAGWQYHVFQIRIGG